MIVINEPLLAELRLPGKCEACGKQCTVREPAHIFARGLGGGSRLDIRCNLVSVGSTRAFQCECHRRHHDGFAPTCDDLLKIAAGREGCMPHEIREVVDWFKRQTKWSTQEQLLDATAELTDGGTRLLAGRCLNELNLNGRD